MNVRLLILLTILILSDHCFAQIPILNSNPSITNKVIYLDFDGELVSGTGWNSGNVINALPSTLNTAGIRTVFQRVSEDYRPFDVNVTTDTLRFKNAPPNRRTHVIITPTSAWYGSAGGVAYIGSFNFGGTPGTPCWVFENQLGYSPSYIGEACSHETGHTLSLLHHSTYSLTPTCTKTAEYDPGQGTGVTSWASIMGVSYYKTVTTWYNGRNSQSCTTFQNDHGSGSPGMTGPSFLNFLADDVGDTYATAKNLNLNSLTLLDSGLITTPTDVDVYKFTICDNRYISFAVKPWALDTTTYSGANLDVRFQLFDAGNTLLATDTSLTALQTLKGVNLAPGSYYFTIDGGGSANYSDYGSLGKYYINIKATNPPALTNSIVIPAAICTGQNATFSYTSNGTPTTWQWNVAGTSGNVIYNTPNPAITFTSSGTYTLSLLAASSASASCITIQTISIGALPTLTVSPSQSICPGSNIQINAGGASSYLWMPGAAASATRIVSPSVATTYTVTGSNGLCSNSAVVTLSVYPDFTPSITASSTLVCSGYTVLLSGSGASGYAFSPGNYTTTSAIVSPTVTTNYILTANDGVCSKSVSKLVTVIPDFTLTAATTPSLICPNTTAVLTASGATNYSYSPGGNNLPSSIYITPSASALYTITGSNGVCAHTIVKTVMVIPDYTLSATGFNTLACPGQPVNITMSGASTYTLNPGNISGNSVTILPTITTNYTVTGSDGSCPKSIVNTLTVNPDFNLQVTSSIAIFCSGQSLSLTASGAGNYTFNPGGINTNPAVFSPTAATVYTILASDGTCVKSVQKSLVMNPDFNLNVTVSDSIVCRGKPVTINASGGTSYTINPGGSTSNLAFSTPTASTIYTITASDGTCKKSVTKLVAVSPDFTIHVNASDTTLCPGQTVSLTASGAAHYTVNPGNIISNPAVVSPIASMVYTITGANENACLNKTTASLVVTDCDDTGFAELKNAGFVNMYPNPATDEITISATTDYSKLEVINIVGNTVFEKNNAPGKLTHVTTNGWATGVYFVRIYFKGNEPVVQKLIINR